MKRQQDRDTSPRSKRSRSSFDDPRDRLSPEFERRGRPGAEPRFDDRREPMPIYRDRGYDFDLPPDRKLYRAPRPQDDYKNQEYKSLCLCSFDNVPDMLITDVLYQEFKKFGEFNVKVTLSNDQRIAFINFRFPEDARDAYRAKGGRLILFDRSVRCDPVYPKPPNSMRRPVRRSVSPEIRRDRDPYFNDRARSPHPVDRPPGRPVEGRGTFQNRDGPFVKDQQREREFFPHHMSHVDPEDDAMATRTLFLGNLDLTIEEAEIRLRFERFGPIEEVDIKRPQAGPGMAYAFMKYMDLDCSYRAKVAMSGSLIGKNVVKIGYGKVQPTNCLWIGGLGPWVTPETLEQEFDRFGVITKIDWPPTSTSAFVLFDSIDAAQAATAEMRGFPLGGTDKRIRVDYADEPQIVRYSNIRNIEGKIQTKQFDKFAGKFRPAGPNKPVDSRPDGRGDPINAYRNPDNPRDFDRRRSDDANQIDHRRPRTPEKTLRRSRSPDARQELVNKPGVPIDPKREVDVNKNGIVPSDDLGDSSNPEMASNVSMLSKCLPVAWNGALILKSNAFPARMHVVSGDVKIVDHLMRDPTTTETPTLRIHQRLRLDQPKLEEVGRRVLTVGTAGHCILLALPSTLENFDDQDGQVQQRPLKNLISYLNKKEAAGVVALPPNPTKDKDHVGILYAFPPCQFGHEYLVRKAPRLPIEPSKEEHLVLVVVRGAA